MEWLLNYIIIANLLGIAIMGWDKIKAKSGAWRIPEGNLIFLALIGGSVGIYSGMKIFRHKTRHKKFTVGVPIIFLLQTALVILLLSIQDTL